MLAANPRMWPDKDYFCPLPPLPKKKHARVTRAVCKEKKRARDWFKGRSRDETDNGSVTTLFVNLFSRRMWKVLFHPALTDFRKIFAFWTVRRLPPHVFLHDQHLDEDKYREFVE